MRLESAIFSSREGLTSNGQAISVVGDNVSNANTVGYRTSRAEFSDLLGEQENSAVSSTLPGGGDGSYIATVRQIHEPGTLEFTGRQLDVGIGGGGFFMVGDLANTQYTRAGNFKMAEDGRLQTAEGQDVLGYNGAQIETLGPLNLLNVSQTGSPTTLAAVTGNLDASSALATVPTAPLTFKEVGAAASFVTSQRIYDSLGAGHDVTLAFFKTAPNTWTAQSYIDGGELTGGVAGTPVQLGANVDMTFLEDGSIEPAQAATSLITATPAYANGAGGTPLSLSVGGFTQFATNSIVASVRQDGQAIGNISSYEFRRDGGVYAQMDTGSSVLIGTIPLANFTNLDGLQRSGSTLYSAGTDAGARTVGVAGTGFYGKLEGGALELSGVDISTQFTNLILFQRGYQASSQTLSAANELLQQTLALIR